MHVYVLSRLTCARCYATLWTIARQAPLSMGWSRQEFRSGLPCPPPGDLLSPGIQPGDQTYVSCIAGGFFTHRVTWDALIWYTKEHIPSPAIQNNRLTEFNHLY